MTEFEIKKKELIEKIKYQYFKILQQEIEIASKQKNQARRLALGELYNKLQGLKFKIYELNVADENFKALLEGFNVDFALLLSQYKKLVGKSAKIKSL